MQNLILISQIILGLTLSILVLIQVKGTGFGRVFGGQSSSHTKRGIESLVFKFTFVITFLFILISVISVIL